MTIANISEDKMTRVKMSIHKMPFNKMTTDNVNFDKMIVIEMTKCLSIK